MKKRGKFSFARWCDEWKMVFEALGQSFLRRRFLIAFIITYIVFGTILNLLSGGMGSVNLIKNSDFGGGLKIIFDAFLAVFGDGRNFSDWLLFTGITVLQAILIGFLAIVLKHRKDTDSIQSAGLAAGLAILGSGCPTCGTTLLMPVVVSVFGSSSLAMAGVISWGLTLAAMILALFAIKKLGVEAYAIYEDEAYQKKKAERKEKDGRKK